MVTTPASIDTRQVRRNFARAAAGYHQNAVVPGEIARRMIERLDYVKIAPERVLDLGCGTGISRAALSERYPKSLVLGTDLSEAMLQAGRKAHSSLRWLLPFVRGFRNPLVAADARALPFRSSTLGLIWSNLMLHWLDDPLPAFREMHRTLDSEGLLMFSTFGPDTLKELRACFSDDYAHTQRFTDMHDYGDMLLECGFADPVMDTERLTVTFASVDDLFRELRQGGAACVMNNRRRGLTGRRIWQAARLKYENLMENGRVPATFEVVYGHAWKVPARKTADGHAIVRFDPKQRLR